MTTREDILKLVGKVDKDEKPIFQIMTFTNPDKEMIYPTQKTSGFPDEGTINEPGFYYAIDDALRAVENNEGDIWETCYDAAFILCKFPGLYQSAGTGLRMYYVFNKDTKMYEQKEEPAIFRHVAY